MNERNDGGEGGMDSRKAQEKEYHNIRFTSNIREKADLNYVISNSVKARFDARLDELCRGKSVLEIGCAGGGRMSRFAAAGNRVTAIDISESAIELAKRSADSRYLADIDFHIMDAENLEFSDHSFDVVYGSGILHHLDLARAFEEIDRVLKPGGSAVFFEPLGHNPLLNMYRRRTPDYRTTDEHPLLMSDIRYACTVFPQVSTRYYYLLTLAAIPLARLPFFRPLLKGLEACDRTLFTVAPFVRRYAWMVLLEMRKGGQ